MRRSTGFARPIRSRRASGSSSTLTRCWSRWCCRRRRPMPASTRRRARCLRWPNAAEDGGARRGETARVHQDHRALSRQGEERHRAVGEADRRIGGKVPRNREALETLPGVGRKTANVVLNMAFGEPPWRSTRIFSALPIAPSWRREKRRSKSSWGWRRCPSEFKLHAHHWLILHGRYTCVARKPRCPGCQINDLCRWPEKTV